MNDLKFAVRQLIKSPASTTLAVLTLTIGVAGSCAIFSIFNTLFLRPFPFKEPAQLVDLDEVAPEWNLEYTGVSFADFYEWRKGNRTFSSMGVMDESQFNVTLGATAERLEGFRVSHDLLETLGCVPTLGRGFTPEEDQPGKGEVAMISYKLWQKQFAGDPAVPGKKITLDQKPRTIIGVLPQNLSLLERGDIWIPLCENPAERNGWYLSGIGRLKPGVTPAQALEDLTRIHKGMIATSPVNKTTSPRITLLRTRYLGDYHLVTALLLGAVGIVLLVGCGNVAALMLARGIARQKETGIRFALGAARWQIVRQIFCESMCLSVISAGLGILLGDWGVKAMTHAASERIPAGMDFGMDWRYAVFASGLTIISALIFSLAPMFQATGKLDLTTLLSATASRSSSSRHHRRSLDLLVVGEIALALVLLISAGLVVRTLDGLEHVNPGFRAENVLTYNVALPDAGYSKTQRFEFFNRHLEEIRTLPGVLEASAITSAPFGGHSGTFFQAEGAVTRKPEEGNPVVLRRMAFPQYAKAMGLTLLDGRFLEEQDNRESAPPVIVVNESFVRQFWPGENPVGKRVKYPSDTAPWMTVVGWVKDVKHYGLDKPMRPGVYLPYVQGFSSEMTVVVHTTENARGFFPVISQRLKAQAPNLPMFSVRTMSERLNESLLLRRSYSALFGAFALIAVVMALGGMYGVISYAIGRRTQEIGIRMALGAQTGDVLHLVLSQGMKLAGLGIIIGMTGSLGVARLLNGLLFGISATDPVTFAVVPFVLTSIALLACWLPARRAANLDPITALRTE